MLKLLTTAVVVITISACLLTLYAVARVPNQQRPERRQVLCVILSLLLWLGPVLSFGVTRGPFPGFSQLSYFHNITDLFSKYWSDWASYYVQIRLAGTDRWITVPEQDFNELAAFGGLDRFLLYMWFSHEGSDADIARRKYILSWFTQRYHNLNPQTPAVDAARLLYVSYVPRAGRPPMEAWKRPALDAVPEAEQHILQTEIYSRPEATFR